MSRPATTPRRPASPIRSGPIRSGPITHLASHARLLRDASHTVPPSDRSPRGRLDAIVIPTARPASFLAYPIALAAAIGTPIVVLCSGRANAAQVVERVERVPNARALVIEPRSGNDTPIPEFETSDPAFAKASDGRASDLSLKRNIGLLLSRALGWRKIAYLDDDIVISPTDVARIAHQLGVPRDRRHGLSVTSRTTRYSVTRGAWRRCRRTSS